MKIDNRIIIAGLALYGYLEYDKFINFINNLQLKLQVQKVDNESISAFIKSDLEKAIPYKFNKVDLILNKQTHLATSAGPNNLALMPINALPFNFNILKPTQIQEVEQSEIAITYSFFGFEFKRLYKPQIINEPITGKQQQPFAQSKGSCGCHK